MAETYSCKNCGKERVVSSDRSIFCNSECYHQYRKTHPEEYKLPDEVYKLAGRKGSVTIRKNGGRLGDRNSNWKPKVSCICEYCKVEFFVTKNYKDKTVRYCSRKCKDLSQTGLDKGGKTVIVCEACRRSKTILTYLLKKGLGRYCSRVCSNKALKNKIGREKHHNWKGGTSLEPYPFDFNEELKELIRKRDSYRCQLCGVPQIECLKKLPIHHIDYCKEHCDPKNLITVCNGCNAKINFNREHWQEVFAKKLNAEGGVKEECQTASLPVT